MSEELSAEDQIVAAIRRIIRAVDLHSRRLLEGYGLTGPQLTVLRSAARLGSGSVSALARSVHLSQPTVTGIVDRLERRGFVERSRDQVDRRAVKVTVTAVGHSILDRAPSLLQDRFRSELEKLKQWELTMTLASLQRIAAMMEAESLEASPVLVAGPMDAVPVDAGADPAPAAELEFDSLGTHGAASTGDRQEA